MDLVLLGAFLFPATIMLIEDYFYRTVDIRLVALLYLMAFPVFRIFSSDYWIVMQMFTFAGNAIFGLIVMLLFRIVTATLVERVTEDAEKGEAKLKPLLNRRFGFLPCYAGAILMWILWIKDTNCIIETLQIMDVYFMLFFISTLSLTALIQWFRMRRIRRSDGGNTMYGIGMGDVLVSGVISGLMGCPIFLHILLLALLLYVLVAILSSWI